VKFFDVFECTHLSKAAVSKARLVYIGMSHSPTYLDGRCADELARLFDEVQQAVEFVLVD
jgi:hypothetical protein